MSVRKTIFLVVVFSIAMGYLEAAVVIYLREIYYPAGFMFPLKGLGERDLFVELGRELATLIMLISIGLISGKTRMRRFAFFLLAFGVWDITYYLFLWIVLHWPASLLAWDILFLLPVVWVGPVLAPCILSLTMILCTAVILRGGYAVKMTRSALICLISGSLIVIASFCEDPLRHLSSFNHVAYVPTNFLWGLFFLGEAVILTGIYQLYRSRLK